MGAAAQSTRRVDKGTCGALRQAPRPALAASKHCMAAAGDPHRDGFAEELAATRKLYQHPETRRRVSEFLDRTQRRAVVSKLQ